MSKIKLDLHVHTKASRDSGMEPETVVKIIASGALDIIAITDHNTIELAQKLNRKLGRQIIVGEEVMTVDGEIIGLFLEYPIEAGLSALETCQQIKKQGGLVYIPHPFETRRKGLQAKSLKQIAHHVDIVEIYNGRTLQNKSAAAIQWATENRAAPAASSDAHGIFGIGRTYMLLKDYPDPKTLVPMLKKAEAIKRRPSPLAYLEPFKSRVARRFGQ